MKVKQLIDNLEEMDRDLEVLVLIEGDENDYPIAGVREGELEDDEQGTTESVVFIMG
jgi:hypothetical protein